MKKEEMIKMISIAEEEDLSRMIEAIIKRQKQLHPDWEPLYLSCPLKQPDECRLILETTWKILSDIMKSMI